MHINLKCTQYIMNMQHKVAINELFLVTAGYVLKFINILIVFVVLFY